MMNKKHRIKLHFYPLDLGREGGWDDEFSKDDLKRMLKLVCKPCWELKYCPYGPLVEGYPLPSITKEEAIEKDELDKNIPKEVYEMSCTVFGHLCPVFFNSEPVTETRQERKSSRSIPRDVLLRVVRRDESTCQRCGKKLRDKEIEIDHTIPISKGGATTESNLRVLCFSCNREKAASLTDLLSEDSILKNNPQTKKGRPRRHGG